MTAFVRIGPYWRALAILILFVRSETCFGAAQSSLEKAKAISSAILATATTPADRYLEASEDSEHALADLRYDLLIGQILDSDEESKIASGKIKNRRRWQFSQTCHALPSDVSAYVLQGCKV